MKKAVKGLILLPISILISVNQGINKNFDVSKTSFINALTVSPLKKGIEKAKGFKVILTEKKPKEDFVSSFDYYKIHETISPIVLADVLNKNVFDSEIVEIKLILNPKDYDFDEYNDVISKSTPVLETIKRDGNEGLIKSFYVPTTQEIEAIKSKAKDISPKEEIYPSLITSLTMEASYKSSLPRITSRYSVAKSNQVDNQAALDHYLETFNQQVDVLGLGFGKSEQTENIFTTDDSIINLIPKNCFTTNGKFSHGGAEWGYFVDTYNDNSRGKMSSIFIYDIYNLKTDLLNPETIQIKPILSYNYKYDMEMNVVYKDGPNNYCMGNPSFKSAITYANIPGSTNTKKFLNYGESGYSQLNDNGFCIGSNSVKYVGVGKTYDKKIEDVEKIALFLGGIALSAATSGMSLGASVAIGAAYDLIGDALIEKLNSEIKEVNLNTINNSEKYEKSITNIVGYSSYEYARQAGDLAKAFYMNMQDRDGGFTGEPNRNCPLLFKTSSDSINYQFQLYSSDKSDEYAGYLANDLKVEIFNDNSFPIFKADPDFIGTSYAKWIHYIGEDVTPKDITIENGAFDSFAIFGKNHSQKIYFTPKESGTYDILVHDMPDNTTLRLSNLTDQSGSGSYIDIWGNSRRVSGKNFLKFYINMTGGSRYSLSLEKKINGYGYFGTARFNIYLSNRNVLTPTGSSEYGRNYSWRTITYSGMAVNTQFIPTTNGQYTFVLNGSGTEDKDTYIRILDQNFNEIISDDDGWGRNISGAKLNLIANRQYFVISRLYSPNSSGNLEIDVLKQIYFPELQGRILQKTIWLNNMGYVKNMYFLTSQSTNRTIRFGAAPDTTPVGNQPKLSLTIKDTKLYTVANSDDIIASDFVFTFTKDVPYLLEFSLSSYSYTGGINLYVKSA